MTASTRSSSDLGSPKLNFDVDDSNSSDGSSICSEPKEDSSMANQFWSSLSSTFTYILRNTLGNSAKKSELTKPLKDSVGSMPLKSFGSSGGATVGVTDVVVRRDKKPLEPEVEIDKYELTKVEVGSSSRRRRARRRIQKESLPSAFRKWIPSYFTSRSANHQNNRGSGLVQQLVLQALMTPSNSEELPSDAMRRRLYSLMTNNNINNLRDRQSRSSGLLATRFRPRIEHYGRAEDVGYGDFALLNSKDRESAKLVELSPISSKFVPRHAHRINHPESTPISSG